MRKVSGPGGGGGRRRTRRRRGRGALDVGTEDVATGDFVEQPAIRGIEGDTRDEIGAHDLGGRVHDECQVTEPDANEPWGVAGGDGEILESMHVGGFGEGEQEVHNLVEGAVALDVPADFVGAADLSRADGEAGKIGLLKAAEKDVLGEDLAGFGTGLVDGVGEGFGGETFEAILGGEVVASLGLDLLDLLADHSGAFVEILEGLDEPGADAEAEDKDGDEGSDDDDEGFLSGIHAPPFR